jgi:hypothetical protein
MPEYKQKAQKTATTRQPLISAGAYIKNQNPRLITGVNVERTG